MRIAGSNEPRATRLRGRRASSNLSSNRRTGHAPCSRGTANDHGSVTLLVPVGVLVLVILAAIAVDLTLVGSAQHAIRYAAASAADDAASQIDEQAIRVNGAISIDMERARRVAEASLATADLPGKLVGAVQVDLVQNGAGVQVTAAIEVPHIFGKAVPGVPDTERIEATSFAELELR